MLSSEQGHSISFESERGHRSLDKWPISEHNLGILGQSRCEINPLIPPSAPGIQLSMLASSGLAPSKVPQLAQGSMYLCAPSGNVDPSPFSPVSFVCIGTASATAYTYFFSCKWSNSPKLQGVGVKLSRWFSWIPPYLGDFLPPPWVGEMLSLSTITLTKELPVGFFKP